MMHSEPIHVSTCPQRIMAMQGVPRPGARPAGAQQEPPLSTEDEQPKVGLARAWEVAKMLYENEVTRQVVVLT